MSKARIAIVDYGMGNLFSVQRACDVSGIDAFVARGPDELERADGFILPGIGAFGTAMRELNESGMSTSLIQAARSGKPLLGICLGLQLLMTESHEFGRHLGLDLIPGSVRRLPELVDGERVKVPQVGWRQVHAPSAKPWAQSLLQGVANGTFMYFVHSYYVEPMTKDCVVAVTSHGGYEYCSAIARDNIFACQFHPERSGGEGLRIYANFAAFVEQRNIGRG